MEMVRSVWAEKVADGRETEVSPSAPVIQVFRACWSQLERSGHAQNIHQLIVDNVCATEEWRESNRSVASDMYESVFGQLPPLDVLDSLSRMQVTDDIAASVLDMHERGEIPHAQQQDILDQPHQASAPEPECVDTEWMHAFAGAFHRDPFVHEYILLRRMDKSLEHMAAVHKQSFEQMRKVHAQYLDADLDERDFVKEYVPDIYMREDIVDCVRMGALEKPEYRNAMVSRLSHLHAVLCGAELNAHEAEHIFLNDVLGQGLPLDTDELNEILVCFITRGEQIRNRIRSIYHIYMRRDAESDEVDNWLHPFRVSDSSEDDLRKCLADSYEFHAVVAQVVKEHMPHARNPDVFREVSRVLQQEGLASLQDPAELDDLILQGEYMKGERDA